MEKKHPINIPKPCHESWDTMMPCDGGRLCEKCSMTVVDFSTQSSDEIQHYFIQNKNNKICGRFKKSQLDSIHIEIPHHVFSFTKGFDKIFLLSLFVTMGTTLFSCSDKEGNKKKIDTIEVVTDQTDQIVVGEAPIDNSASHNIPPPLAKKNTSKFTSPLKKSQEEISQNSKDIQTSTAANAEVLPTNAEYPGGIDQFYTLFSKEFKNPDDSYSQNRKIKISFAVEKNGAMSFLQADPAVEKSVENEIIRVLNLCAKWQPAELRGKKIRVQYSLPLVLE
jgi:hypothetical protein